MNYYSRFFFCHCDIENASNVLVNLQSGRITAVLDWEKSKTYVEDKDWQFAEWWKRYTYCFEDLDEEDLTEKQIEIMQQVDEKIQSYVKLKLAEKNIKISDKANENRTRMDDLVWNSLYMFFWVCNWYEDVPDNEKDAKLWESILENAEDLK